MNASRNRRADAEQRRCRNVRTKKRYLEIATIRSASSHSHGM